MKKTIVLSKGGTKERRVPIGEIQIPDLWHLAQWHIHNADKDGGREILECWHLCNDLRRALQYGDNLE